MNRRQETIQTVKLFVVWLAVLTAIHSCRFLLLPLALGAPQCRDDQLPRDGRAYHCERMPDAGVQWVESAR